MFSLLIKFKKDRKSKCLDYVFSVHRETQALVCQAPLVFQDPQDLPDPAVSQWADDDNFLRTVCKITFIFLIKTNIMFVF